MTRELALCAIPGGCDGRGARVLRRTVRADGDSFRAGFERASDLGASLALTMSGELVVDLWGGYRDLAHTQPWEADTVAPVYSTSKIIVAIAALMVSQHGKAAITTRQVPRADTDLDPLGRARGIMADHRPRLRDRLRVHPESLLVGDEWLIRQAEQWQVLIDEIARLN